MFSNRLKGSVYATVFIQSCGHVGLVLLPALLASRNLSGAEIAVILAVTKSGLIVGAFLGGFLSDVLGSRNTLIVALLLAALIGAVPFATSTFLIGIFAFLTQLGQSMVFGPYRFLAIGNSAEKRASETMGWFRASKNFGQIIGYGIATLLAGFGAALLMAVNSLLCLTAGGSTVLLKEPTEKVSAPSQNQYNRSNLIRSAVLWSGYWFLYELFLVGLAAKCTVVYGKEGLGIFTSLVLFNAILCAALSVPAARLFKKIPDVAFSLGTLLLVTGLLIITTQPPQVSWLATGALFISLGEIVFMAVAEVNLLQALPPVSFQGTVYGSILVFQGIGRILASTTAFAFIVQANHLSYWLSAGIFLSLIPLRALTPLLNKRCHSLSKLNR